MARVLTFRASLAKSSISPQSTESSAAVSRSRGLESLEARDLALLLRAGALAAPIYKVEERTVGPSLGQDNIDRGFRAFLIGFAVVAVFMILYYKIGRAHV